MCDTFLRVQIGLPASASLCLALSLLSPLVLGQAPTSPNLADEPIKVSPAVASSLVIERPSPQYSPAARKAGIEGVVVLHIVVGKTGHVDELSVVSGDPMLSESAIDAVKQWKYKPYTVNGVPVEIETELSFTFHLQVAATPPSLGTFRDGVYENGDFNFDYPLPAVEWIRETELMRKLVPPPEQSGMFVLLAALRIPQKHASLEAESSFVLSALRKNSSTRGTCETYIEEVAKVLLSNSARQHGTVQTIEINGHRFARADFEFRARPNHRSVLCSETKDYLFEWDMKGDSEADVERAVSTLNEIHWGGPSAGRTASNDGEEPASASNQPGTTSQPVRVRVSQGVSAGLKIKDVRPVYPEPAKLSRIQGSGAMNAVISRTGDISDIEVLAGPVELVVSAVTAVRQWKYKPYLLKGEPVEVNTTITVMYTLSGF